MKRGAGVIGVVVALVGAGVALRGDSTARHRRTEVLGVQLTPPPHPALPPRPDRGVVYDGLQQRLEGVCGRLFALQRTTDLCTHGPDPAPEGVNVKEDRGPVPAGDAGSGVTAAAAGGGSIVCDGDGTSGKRVQAMYVRPSDRSDRSAQFAASFRQWAADADAVFDGSAAKTGGSRHIRFVTDGSCNLTIVSASVSPSGAGSLDTTIDELRSQGFNRSDRYYLIWMDANVYCGIASLFLDDRPGQDNRNNSGAGFARVDAGCWGLGPTSSVEAHELMHNMGGVQTSAPHATQGHCTDDNDRMCYKDAPDTVVSIVCSDPAAEGLFDCNDDDYFNTSPAGGSYLATHWNTANSAFLLAGLPSAPGRFVPLTPARILDTRTGTGGFTSAVGPGGTINVQITGQGGVPSSGVAAVVLNVTAVDPTQAGYLTVFPSGTARPLASNLNFTAGRTVPNLVEVKVGTAGRVSVFNASGATHVLFDVAGYYTTDTSGASGRYQPVTPARVLDTRTGSGGVSVPLGAGQSLDLQVAGKGGIPSSGASGVVVNVTATDTNSSSYLTVYPSGAARPVASNLNFVAGQTVPNRVATKLGPNGSVSLFNASGSTNVIVDVNGWFTDGSGSSSTGIFTSVDPARVLDTRSSGAVGPGGVLTLKVAGKAGVPAGASAVAVNVTAADPTASSFLTVYPANVSRPLASDLNFISGATVPNLVVVKLSPAGEIAIYNASGSVNVIVDVAGWVS